MSERTELIEWCERMYGDAECGYHFQQQLRRIARMLREPAASREVQEGEAWREPVARLVKGFEHVSGIARQWEPDHSSGADRAKWARATEACADVAKLLTSLTPRTPGSGKGE